MKGLRSVGKAASPDGHWIQNAIGGHKGALHRALGCDESKPIPPAKMAEARSSSDPHIRRMVALADTLKSLN